MNPILKCAVLLGLGLAASLQTAHGQEVSAYFGLGGAYDASSIRSINTFGDGTLYKTPTQRGPMGQLGMSVLLGRRWGVGAEISRRLGQGDYAGLNYSLSFSSLDVTFRTAGDTTTQFEPEYRVGLGAARLHYSYDDQNACDQIPGCPLSTHFQVRFAAAGRIYVSNHMFFRPAVDIHYVNHFSEFRFDWVPEYSIGIGYSLGRGR